jgi:signal recognition particle subunit SRP54
MGDILTLVEKAQEELDISDLEKMQSKIVEAKFDFNDFIKQMRVLKTMGSLGGVLKLIPGMNKLSSKDLAKGESQLNQTEAMINSMTKEERSNPDLLAKSPGRRRRIAKGSGFQERDVSKLVTDFTRMRSMMQQMSTGRMPALPGMGDMGAMFGGGNAPNPGKKGTKPKKKKKGFGDL